MILVLAIDPLVFDVGRGIHCISCHRQTTGVGNSCVVVPSTFSKRGSKFPIINSIQLLLACIVWYEIENILAQVNCISEARRTHLPLQYLPD